MRSDAFTSFSDQIAAIDPADSKSAEDIATARADLEKALSAKRLALAEWRELWERTTEIQSKIASAHPSGWHCAPCYFTQSQASFKEALEQQRHRSRVASYYASKQGEGE